jgi:Holliday junction resolvase RusA-like endonuclease
MITIYGNVPSSKNSKQLFKSKKTGKLFIAKSKLCLDYEKNTKLQWIANKKKFDKMFNGYPLPLEIKFKFFRDSNRKADFVNLVQLPLDLMVKHGWIPDDNYNEVLPIFLPVEIDKKNPRLEIYG